MHYFGESLQGYQGFKYGLPVFRLLLSLHHRSFASTGQFAGGDFQVHTDLIFRDRHRSSHGEKTVRPKGVMFHCVNVLNLWSERVGSQSPYKIA
jgi:hypothetical protein